MDERTKDKIEDGASAVVEASVSLIPFLGGPAAVLVNRAFGSATQRRNEALFAELTDRIEGIVQRMEATEAERLLESETFQAAAHRVFRASQETASTEKRKLLQNALLNGYLRQEFVSDRDEFLADMIRYSPEHVLVLRAMEEIMRGRDETLPHATSRIAGHLNDEVPEENVRKCVQVLVNDGLLSRHENSKVEQRDVFRGGSVRRRETEQVVKTEVRHSNTERGKNFLRLLADPDLVAG
ncbi:MAG TPA: hypothetical protein VF885_19575 [Arthrobacter sp.]